MSQWQGVTLVVLMWHHAVMFAAICRPRSCCSRCYIDRWLMCALSSLHCIHHCLHHCRISQDTAHVYSIFVCCCQLQAQELMRQMARRQLYKFVQEVTVTPAARRIYNGLPTAEEIIGYQSSAKFDGVSIQCGRCLAMLAGWRLCSTVVLCLSSYPTLQP
jgi:hypothetical protein